MARLEGVGGEEQDEDALEEEEDGVGEVDGAAVGAHVAGLVCELAQHAAGVLLHQQRASRRQHIHKHPRPHPAHEGAHGTKSAQCQDLPMCGTTERVFPAWQAERARHPTMHARDEDLAGKASI